MKNNEKKLLTEILRVQELMGLKQLINEEGGKYGPVVDFFKSVLKISSKDLKFTSMFDEAFEHIKSNNLELVEKLKKSLGTNEISINGLKGFNSITSIKTSELKSLLENLQKEMVSYIFTKYSDDFIEMGDELINNSLINKPNLKAAYDHMVNLAERGEAEELQIAIQNAKKINAFPDYVLDHIQNTKFVQKAEDAALDAIEKSGDEFVDAVSDTVVDSVGFVAKGLKVVGGKVVGLGKMLRNGAKKINSDTLLDAIELVFPNFSKATFVRGYKGLVDDVKFNDLCARGEALNVRFAELVKSGDDVGMQKLEQDLTKYLNDLNRWVLASQKRIIDHWKINLSEICNDEGIPDAVDRFFGKVQRDGTNKLNIITPELSKALDDALQVQGQVLPKNYVGVLDGYKRMFPILKRWRGDKRSVKTFIERFSKFLAYGDPRLFSETADNIIYAQGLKGYLKKEAKRRVLFAFVYWFLTYTIQDFAKAYVLGTKDEKSWLYNTFLSMGLTPNTKFPENRDGENRYDVYKRWLAMAFINYWGINSEKLSNSFIGSLSGIKGDKEWETLNTPTADELKNQPEIAREKLSRRGNWKNKFFESPIIGLIDYLEYRNAGAAQTDAEAKANGYIEVQMKDFEKDPNLPTDSVQRKIAIDSMKTVLQQSKAQMRKYMDSAENDFKMDEQTKK